MTVLPEREFFRKGGVFGSWSVGIGLGLPNEEDMRKRM